VVELAVHNLRKHLDSWALVLEDRLRNVLPGTGGDPQTARCLVPYVAAGSSRSATYRAKLWQRGRYRFGPVKVSTKVPVGLLQGRVTLPENTDLLVFPRLGRLNAGWTQLVKHHQLGQRSSRRNQGPVEGDFYGLRDWRAGDSRRWIHWRSSAKRQDLVVRQFEQHHSQDLVIVLDLHQLPPTTSPLHAANRPGEPAQAHAEELVERAVSFVATVLVDYCRQAGGRLTLIIAGHLPRMVRGSASSALLGDVLELLAEATPPSQDVLPGMLADALAGTSAGDRVMIVATGPIDLNDRRRFPGTPARGARRAKLHESICLDVSHPSFRQVFDADEMESEVEREVAAWQR
jgi:uncharacterized protein (DUF58 family)